MLVGLGGFLLGQRLKSPEDARAVVAAPKPSKIAVPIEQTALSNDVVVRGDASYEGAVDLRIAQNLGDGATRVVTGQVPEVDSNINEGEILIEVSGRPVFALQGDLPAFRDFKPGLVGDDVKQLEESLHRLGFLTVAPDATYDQNTEAALTALYEKYGYDARAETEAQKNQIKSAKNAVEQAQRTLSDARTALSEANPQRTALQIEQDRQSRDTMLRAIKEAEEALEKARVISASYQNVLNASGDVYAGGSDEEIEQSQQAVAQAQKAHRDGIKAAEERLEAAQRALADADRLEAARNASTTGTQRQQQAVTDAEKNLTEAKNELQRLEDEFGVRLPSAEVVFLPKLPRTITSVNVKRGDVVGNDAVMRISGTEVRITTGVSTANRKLLDVGQKVTIDSQSLGIELEGSIKELADRAGTKGVADNRYYMLVVPEGEYKVSDLVGVNFRIRISLDQSEGDVLAVPLAALSTGADSTARVELLIGDDESELVPVKVGLSDKNRSLVEIQSLGRELKAGDLVVVGVEQGQKADDGAQASDDSSDSSDSTEANAGGE